MNKKAGKIQTQRQITDLVATELLLMNNLASLSVSDLTFTNSYTCCCQWRTVEGWGKALLLHRVSVAIIRVAVGGAVTLPGQQFLSP